MSRKDRALNQQEQARRVRAAEKAARLQKAVENQPVGLRIVSHEGGIHVLISRPVQDIPLTPQDAIAVAHHLIIQAHRLQEQQAPRDESRNEPPPSPNRILQP